MNKKDFISPWHTLTLLAGIGLLIFLGIFVKLDGRRIGPFELMFPTEEDLTKGSGRSVDMERLLQDYHEIDVRGKRSKQDAVIDSVDISTEIISDKDTTKKKVEEVYTPPPRDLQWDKTGDHPLHNFFAHINKHRSKMTRVLHYGDSQIEGDRITARLREELQRSFGGNGPGLQSFTPLVKSWSIRSEASNHWKRYPGFGKKDTNITHNEYGPLISISRYETNDSVKNPYVDIGPSKSGYKKIRSYDVIDLYFGNVVDTVVVAATSNDSIFSELIIHPGSVSPKRINLPHPTDNIRLTFDGPTADWYGYSAQSTSGIIVDNIALRGASGTFFSNINTQHFTGHFAADEVKLLILQFGGNVVPYIDAKKRAEAYGKRMEREIAVFQKRFPNADILFIGPSDMATKVRTNMETFPHLIDVRDALKEAAFNRGVAYWDIFEAMGGENSMESWVTNDPPLAASDYVHFTPKGASVVAQWLTEAIMDSYQEWKKSNQTP